MRFDACGALTLTSPSARGRSASVAGAAAPGNSILFLLSNTYMQPNGVARTRRSLDIGFGLSYNGMFMYGIVRSMR